MHGMSWEWLVLISPLNIQGMSERQHKYPEYHGSGNLGNFTEAPLFPRMKLATTLALQPCILFIIMIQTMHFHTPLPETQLPSFWQPNTPS